LLFDIKTTLPTMLFRMKTLIFRLLVPSRTWRPSRLIAIRPETPPT
jgi:hypothetical protein